MFTPCFRHACLAMTAPSLQNRLAAQRALDAAESIERGMDIVLEAQKELLDLVAEPVLH